MCWKCHLQWQCLNNSSLPSDTTQWHRSGSTIAHVRACCLTAPSHYLNQCWLIIRGVLWHSPDGSFTRYGQDICSWYEFGNYKFKISTASPRGQWVKQKTAGHDSLTSTVVRSPWFCWVIMMYCPEGILQWFDCSIWEWPQLRGQCCQLKILVAQEWLMHFHHQKWDRHWQITMYNSLKASLHWPGNKIW